jgi:16S rRNA (uracil1498-N3)-methyltransferase
MKHLFYSSLHWQHEIRLDADESAHAIKVLRLVPGDEIYITNGKGNLFECRITQCKKTELIADIIKTLQIKRNQPDIHLAIAATKNSDRMEWLVEKVTEMGITTITPLICKHSERKVLKTERLHKMAVSAIKQSRQCWLPVVNELTTYENFINEVTQNAATKLIAHCKKNNLPFISQFVLQQTVPYIACIGPEGDFDQTEIELALKSGFKEISLGTNRLRTETAGLTAVCALQTLLFRE